MTLIAILAFQRQLLNVLVKTKNGILLLLYTISFILYLGVGGTFFLLIEGPQFEDSQKEVLDIKSVISKKYPGIPDAALDDYLNELRAIGVRGLPNPNGTVIPWTFADAVFFSATLLTTIGYGHVAPRSVLGKLFCMIYTACGIPVTLLFLANYVNILLKISESYKAALFHKFQGVFKPFYIRLAHITTVMALIILLCFILPAIFFSHFEKGWGVFDGIYYCFISLTTVGLGDLVPALDPNMPHADAYKYAATFYMIVGVTVMMFMTTMAADFHQNYNCCYETLPFTISEKIPINTKHTESYGSLLTKNENHKIITQGPSYQNKVEALVY